MMSKFLSITIKTRKENHTKNPSIYHNSSWGYFMLFFRLCMGLIVLLTYSVSLGTASDQLKKLIDLALTNSPYLRKYTKLTTSIEKRGEYASSLPNPRISLGFNNLPISTPYPTPNEPMSSFSIGFSQMFTLPSKRNSEKQVYTAEKEMLKYQYELEKRNLISNLKENFYRYQYTFKKEDIYKEILKYLDVLEKFAEENYKLGKVSLHDIISVKVKRKDIEKYLVELDKERSLSLENIKYICGKQITIRRENIQLTNFDFKANNKENIENSPMIREFHSKIDVLKAELEKTKLEYLPDIEFMLEYMIRPSMEGMFSLRINIPIPFWKTVREDNMVLEKIENIKAMEDSLEDLKLRVTKEVNNMYTEYYKNRDTLDILNKLKLEKINQLKSLEFSYRYSKVGFKDLFMGYSELWDVNIMILEKEVEMLVIASRLEVIL